MMVNQKNRASYLAAAPLNIDGILFLAKLLGLESFPPVLGLHDNVYFHEDQQKVDDITVQELWEKGYLNLESGTTDPDLERWLKTLAEPDIYISLRAMEGHRMRRAVVARKGTGQSAEHVLAARRGDGITVQGIWSGASGLEDVVVAPLWAALKPTQDGEDPAPADLKPLTLPLETFTKLASGTPGEMVRSLARHGYDMRTARILNEASQYGEASGHGGQRTEIVITQNMGIKQENTPAAVSVADTSFGRVVFSPHKQQRRIYGTFLPGSKAHFRDAISNLVSLTPERNWFTATPRW